MSDEPISKVSDANSILVNGIFPDLFKDIVGQSEATKRIQFYLRSYKDTHHIPNLLFTAQKGNGKTALARETAKGLLKFDEEGKIEVNSENNIPRRKKLIEINCSILTNVNDFFDGWILPKVQDKDVTLFFDEASEIPHDIAMALLTILAPNKIITHFVNANFDVQFNRCHQSFLFATSEPQKIFHALLDRLKRIDLQEYSLEEIALIIQKGAKDIEFEKGVLESIASVSRGNARNAQDYSGEVKTYLGKESGKFTMENWEDLKNILSVAPLGLNASEINLLRLLKQSPHGVSLTALAAKMGMSREALQRDYELYLQKHSLMSIEAGKGRVLTPKGHEYLALLK